MESRSEEDELSEKGKETSFYEDNGPAETPKFIPRNGNVNYIFKNCFIFNANKGIELPRALFGNRNALKGNNNFERVGKAIINYEIPKINPRGLTPYKRDNHSCMNIMENEKKIKENKSKDFIRIESKNEEINNRQEVRTNEVHVHHSQIIHLVPILNVAKSICNIVKYIDYFE